GHGLRADPWPAARRPEESNGRSSGPDHVTPEERGDARGVRPHGPAIQVWPAQRATRNVPPVCPDDLRRCHHARHAGAGCGRNPDHRATGGNDRLDGANQIARIAGCRGAPMRITLRFSLVRFRSLWLVLALSVAGSAQGETLEKVILRENPLFKASEAHLMIGRDGKVYLSNWGLTAGRPYGFVLRISRGGKDKFRAEVLPCWSATANKDGVMATASPGYGGHQVAVYDPSVRGLGC